MNNERRLKLIRDHDLVKIIGVGFPIVDITLINVQCYMD